jgi:hypothetical protein
VHIPISIQQFGDTRLYAVSAYEVAAACAPLSQPTLQWVIPFLKKNKFQKGRDYLIRTVPHTDGTPDYILTLACAAALADSLYTPTGADVAIYLLSLDGGPQDGV